MAGNYPDAADRRIPYDIDGTVVYVCGGSHTDPNLNTMLFKGSTALRDTQDEDSDEIFFNTNGPILPDNQDFAVFIFPQPMDLRAAYYVLSGADPYVINVKYSTDTTNGIDGTWSTLHADGEGTGGGTETGYRTHYVEFVANAARAVTWQVPRGTNLNKGRAYTFHLYGKISAGYTPDRIKVIDYDAAAEFTKVHDWGDTPRGITLEKTFKLENASTSLTANNVKLNFDDLTYVADTWHTLKDWGGSFSTGFTITSISPSATYPANSSEYITMRLTIPSTEQLSLRAPRMVIATSSWT